MSLPEFPPLRVGLVGATQGRVRYGAVLAGETDRLKVVGLADADLRATRAWARDLPGKPPVFPDLAKLLSAVPDLEALLLALPLPDRAAQIALAVRAHKPVLYDFPFAAGLPEMDALTRLAAENAILLMPALPRRFDPAFKQVAQEIAAGTLGTLRQARCDWSFPLGAVFALENGVDPDRGNRHMLLQALACQTADVCRWWLGDAQTVSADIDLPPKTGTALIRKRASEGPLANIIVAHTHGQSTHHLSPARSLQPGERYVLTGSLGRLELVVSAGEATSTDSVPALTLHRPGQRTEPLFSAPPDTDLPTAAPRIRGLLHHFADCVQQGTAPEVQAVDARAALEIVYAAYVSTHENIKVPLPLRPPPDLDSLLNLS